MKDYFNSAKCLEDVKELYKKYVLELHPDKGGNMWDFIEIKNNMIPHRIFTSDLYDFDDIIYGDFLIVDTNSEDFIDLEEPFSSFFSLMLDATTYMTKEDFKC